MEEIVVQSIEAAKPAPETVEPVAGAEPGLMGGKPAAGTAVPCDVRHNPLKTSPFGMTIYNHAAIPIHITQIQIYWNPSSPSGQKMKTIRLGGTLIWSSETTLTPFTVSTFIGEVEIGAGLNELLQVDFDKNYKSTGIEQIIVDFAENGCPTLDSSNEGQLEPQ